MVAYMQHFSNHSIPLMSTSGFLSSHQFFAGSIGHEAHLSNRECDRKAINKQKRACVHICMWHTEIFLDTDPDCDQFWKSRRCRSQMLHTICLHVWQRAEDTACSSFPWAEESHKRKRNSPQIWVSSKWNPQQSISAQAFLTDQTVLPKRKSQREAGGGRKGGRRNLSLLCTVSPRLLHGHMQKQIHMQKQGKGEICHPGSDIFFKQ